MFYTVPLELPIVTREHFNRWYNVRSYYLANKFADLPVQITAASVYTIIIYFISGQILELYRLGLTLIVYVVISLIAQLIGLITATIFNLQVIVLFLMLDVFLVKFKS